MPHPGADPTAPHRLEPHPLPGLACEREGGRVARHVPLWQLLLFLPASSGMEVCGSLVMAIAEVPGSGSTSVGVKGQTRGIHCADVDHKDHCQGDASRSRQVGPVASRWPGFLIVAEVTEPWRARSTTFGRLSQKPCPRRLPQLSQWLCKVLNTHGSVFSAENN